MRFAQREEESGAALVQSVKMKCPVKNVSELFHAQTCVGAFGQRLQKLLR